DALASFSDKTDDRHVKHGVRRVRLVKSERPEYLVQVADASGNTYKAYSAGANAFIDILELPDGKWTGVATSVFAANRNDRTPSWPSEFPDARFVMRVFKGDLLSIDHDGISKVVRVVRLEPSASRLRLSEH